MAEYIEREAAIESLVGLTSYDNAPALNAAVEKEYHNGREWIGGVRDALIEIGDLPAADVVEVVRCRDCEWWGHAGCAILIVDDTDKPRENDFCSFGERKDGGQDE